MLLLLIAVVVLLFNLERITLWGLDLMETQVFARLPAETTDEEVQRLRAGFAGLEDAVKNDTIDPIAFNELQPLMMRFADGSRRPTPEEVRELIDVLERAAGLAPSPSTTSGATAGSGSAGLAAMDWLQPALQPA